MPWRGSNSATAGALCLPTGLHWGSQAKSSSLLTLCLFALHTCVTPLVSMVPLLKPEMSLPPLKYADLS